MPKFKVGDKVRTIGFTDCFGCDHEPITGLTIASVKRVECLSIPVYYRCKAYLNGYPKYEAAERFYAMEAN